MWCLKKMLLLKKPSANEETENGIKDKGLVTWLRSWRLALCCLQLFKQWLIVLRPYVSHLPAAFQNDLLSKT